MMKEKNLDGDNQTFQGEDPRSKRVKEEEDMEMHLSRQEATTQKLPGKAGENGLPHSISGKNPLDPQQPASGPASDKRLLMEHRMGHGPRTPAFAICRSQMGDLPHWCLECGKNFGQKTELEKHQLNHARQCSYICSDCGRSFTEHVGLPTHQAVCPAGNSYSHSGCRRRSLPLPNETVVQRKERKELSLQEKVRVLEMLEGPKVSQSELAKRFGVSQPQICRIIKNKERILAEWCKNANPGRKRKLEEKGVASNTALLQWFERSCVSSVSPNGMLLQDKAKSLSEALGKPEWDAGLGWSTGFKARQKGPLERPLTEKQNGDEQLEEEPWESTVLPCILSKYDPFNIYACGEAGILFRATPEDLAVENREEAKDQLTVLLCTNLDASDKRDTLIVGKKEKPFGFQGVDVEELPVSYRAHSKAWMTTAIFTEWLQKFNEDMQHKQRTVVLFLVQCAVHPYMELSNIKMVFVPPSSPQTHPLEQGVIQNFKCHYRRRMLTRLLVVLDSQASASTGKLSKHLTLLDAVHMIAQAWSEVCPQTITNCFRAAGFGLSPRILAPPVDVVQALGFMNQKQFEQFVLVDEGLECFGDQEEAAEMVKECPEPTCGTAEDEEKAEDLPLLTCPSKTEVMESLAKLRRYFECHSVSPTMFQLFYKLEDMVHGMSLANMQALRAWNKE
ncbi:tigger transposable element-derived protein 3-like [Hemicordylus capensis]|uniref:tigger transposable element-derived protein 3-like n=1 Tax=Hemicordylus capensis TaxID=884348 RepID=UPI0023030C7E|nr:tigger transposable element-derived protein 3-like [Hemicordylus capensis]XP_053121507.1 tigger transposable element-derived protein 3-like [Hemicordylus capensis]